VEPSNTPANLLNGADEENKCPGMGIKNAPAPKGWRGFCAALTAAQAKTMTRGWCDMMSLDIAD
jgi:hypothetical protein